jgi:Tfp pilus assembly protein PilF
LLRANLYLARGNLEAAEREAREALLARERFADARNSLGVILIHRRRFDEAIRELRIAADDVLYREPHLAWGNLGWAYLEKGATAQALSALRHAVAIEPRFCVGHYRMGDLHYRSGRFAAAVESLERAIGVTDPACERLQDAHRLLGISLMRTDRREDAAAAFRRCRDLGAQTPAGRECVRFLGMLQ